MNLHVGERLPGSGPAHQPGGYVVSALVAETPWYGLYAGRKIFYNFDFTHKRVRETDEAEWVDVYLRTIRYPHLEDPVYVAQRRTLARGEVRRILGGRASNLWPEPIDLLEIPGGRDPFPFVLGHDPEPIVVFARPHGLPLAAWQQTAPPLPALLGVLAEVLEFLRQAHSEGLLLHGLGPAAILVDRGDRIHYVGTDMVVATVHTDLSSEAWGRLFPPQRFPRGYTAPEFFQTEMAPDARGDLYAWGCLAYSLLTGQSPVQIALEQGHPWAQFQEAHFARLERCLREIPETRVRDWAEQLGVGAGALTRDWPSNVVHLFQALLHGDARRRPGTVEEMLAWIDSPPPIPAAAVLALMTGPGSAHVFLDWRGLASGLDMVVRRGVGQPPRTPAEGTLLEQGPACASVADPAVPLTPEPVYYTAFSRRNEEGPTYSAGVSTELEEASPAALVRLANREAGQVADALLPPRLALLFAVQDKVLLIQALSRSDLAVVRGWALTELERLWQTEPALPNGEELARQWLRDPDPVLRQRAAGLLLARPRDDEAILHLALFAGQGDLEESLHMVAVFKAAGLDRAQAERVRAILEGELPTACPECHVQLARRDRADHLRRDHGYIDVEGSPLPRQQALMRLWHRVFSQGEMPAHERILQLLAAAPEGLAPAYVASLKTALTRQEELLGDSEPWSVQDRQGYLACLVKASPVETLLGEMFRSQLPQLHDLALEGWLTILGEKLRPAFQVVPVSNRQNTSFSSGGRLETSTTKITGRSLRQELDRLGASLDEKILVCRRLPEVGVDAGAVRACLGLLEADRQVACAECGARTRLGDLETHLRRLHCIYQFRGARRSLSETRSAVLDAVCGGLPDETAWKTLEEFAQDEQDRVADTQLVTWICQRLITLRSKPRAAALAGLAEVLAQNGAGPRLLPSLVRPLEDTSYQNLARQLALEVGARLDPPVDQALVSLLEPFLSDRTLAMIKRQNTVINLLRTTGKTGPAALRLLEAYVAKTGKLRSIEKLQEIEERVGQAAALDALCARLEDQVRMTCPKCATEMIRMDMVVHLWERHRLVLDGRRVREPWRVLDDWVVDYGLEKDAALLKRCLDLAHKLDPEGGAVLLERTLLRHNIEDRAALEDLSARADKNGATLCPRCFGEIAVPFLAARLALRHDAESLQGAGFRVAISEQGIFPTVTVSGPDELFIRCRETGGRLTRNGALLLIVGPLVMAVIVLTQLLTRFTGGLPVTLFLASGTGMFLGGLVFLLWTKRTPGTRRLVNAVWNELVPELVDELTPEGIAFLGGLAGFSVRKGNTDVRADMLDLACEKVSGLAGADPAPLTPLAALVRLKVEDAFEGARDPLSIVSGEVGRCFRGLLPLSYASVVLADFFGPEAPVWPEGFTARLQILICAQAFAAGLELSDMDMVKTQPTVAASLGLDNLDRLAQLRQLWALQTTRSWESRGQATSIFDLAADPSLGEKYLARTPDLLLKVSGNDIALGSRGVWFQDVCWTEMPGRVEVVDRRVYNDDGFDLVAGFQRFYFRDNPQNLAAPLEAWCAYYFQEFLGGVPAWHNQGATEAGKRLRSVNALVCPQCRVAVLGRVGEVGVELTDE